MANGRPTLPPPFPCHRHAPVNARFFNFIAPCVSVCVSSLVYHLVRACICDHGLCMSIYAGIVHKTSRAPYMRVRLYIHVCHYYILFIMQFACEYHPVCACVRSRQWHPVRWFRAVVLAIYWTGGPHSQVSELIHCCFVDSLPFSWTA